MKVSTGGESAGTSGTAIVEVLAQEQASRANQTLRGRLEPAEIWVLVSAFFSATGWVLSFFGELNRVGYVIAFALAMGAFVLVLKKSQDTVLRMTRIRSRRFRRGLPMLFLLLAILSFLGGALYAPTNYDALSYRLPRTLLWLADGHWGWLAANDPRLNTRSTGFEWLMAPMLLFLRSDRLLFLINWISFLLLPGLVFQWLTAMGVRRRVAWNWMWLAPSGYCFVLQAASISNDTFAAIYALGAMVFALRARATGRVGQAWLGIISAALLTGSKGSNLPLLLPITVALLPSVRALSLRPVGSCLVAGLAMLVSFLPTAIMNIKHCGDWTGAVIERKVFVMSKPLYGVIGNTVQILIQNFVPPFFPWAGYWNTHVDRFLPGWLMNVFNGYFEPGSYGLGELPTEECSGLGFGVMAMLVLSVVAGALYVRRVKVDSSRKISLYLKVLMFLPFVALLVYMMKSGLSVACRIVSPYYCLLLPFGLLGHGQLWVVSRSWWQWLARLVLLVAAVVVILAPARPLWPASTVLRKLHQMRPNSALLARAERVYSVYSGRRDVLAPVRALIPPQETTIGIVSVRDEPIASIWKPYGQRRLIFLLTKDSVADLKQQGVRYVVLIPEAVQNLFSEDSEAWAAQFNADIVGQVALDPKAHMGTEVWTVVRLRDS
jgi:hypothetical protein